MKQPAILNRHLDFWLLGGASIVVWFAMVVGDNLKSDYPSIEQRFVQIIPAFALLAIVCNYPHFMASYRFAYSKGFHFVFKHWISLLAVPLTLVLIYIYAFFNFQNIVQSENPLVTHVNAFFALLNVGFRVGQLSNLGTEIMSATIWLMYITVGWHYSKQAYGCILTYARIDLYPLSSSQKLIIKLSAFSVAFNNFFYFATLPEYESTTNFLGIPLVAWGVPTIVLTVVQIAMFVLIAVMLYHVFYKNFRDCNRIPSLNFLIPWLALFIWWAPLIRQQEYYLMVIPFFHSLQYLPFVYKREADRTERSNWFSFKLSAKIILLLVIGFCVFDFIPNTLDNRLNTSIAQTAWFFTIAFTVFINIHHYFIDSVIWRFSPKPIVANGN